MKSCALPALYVCTGVCLFAATPELPFSIVENRGQGASSARLIGQGPGVRMEFAAHDVLIQTNGAHARMEMLDSNPSAKLIMEEDTGATINYLVGADPALWKSNLKAFAAARYADVWPGVSLVFRAAASHVKAEYHLGAGAAPGAIRLRFAGTPSAAAGGGLSIQTATGEIAIPAPEVILESGAVAKTVKAEYLVRGDNTVSLNIAAGLAAPLAAGARNPTLLFSGYFGGTSQDNITAVASSTNFNTVVAGWSSSPDLPTTGARRTSGGGVDAFVANFSPVGGQLVYCTYLGGSGDDRAFGIAVDQSKNTYITGWTSSSNFPVVGGVQSRLSGARDAFIVKLNSTGTALLYSTYLGGSGVDSGTAIGIDFSGAAFIVGDTTSPNLPYTTGAYQRRLAGGQDVFVAKINSAGNALSFLTGLGGAATDHGTAIGVEAAGTVVVAGGTYSTDFPTTPGLQTVSGGGQDGFIAKFAADGRSLLWSTYIGGRGGSPGAPELVTGLALGQAGNITFAGITSSANFPVRGNVDQLTFGGGQTDGFVAKLTGSSGAIYLATFLGGSLDDGINAIAGDARGYIYLTGYTSSPDFPTRRAVQGSPGGGLDAFIVKANTGTRILYSTYLGGSAGDSGNAIAVDALTSVTVAGSTGSADFPVAGSMPSVKSGILSGFVAKFSASWSTAISATPSLYYDPWHINGFNGATLVINIGTYGQAGDITVTGDWDGSGVRRIGVFRDGLWILDTNGNGVLDAGDRNVSFGQAGDQPISGYFDGTGRPQLGLYRAGIFILDLSGHLTGVATGNADATFSFGQPGDVPVAGDWNGTGATQVGVFRNGTWLLDANGDHALTNADPTYTFGLAGDIPVVGDWDSSGAKSLIGVYRAGYWILDYAGDYVVNSPGVRQMYFAFGGALYRPLVF